MTSKQLFTSLIDFILHSKLESNELVEALENKYCVTLKPDNSLRCIDKYKVAFENDYITDTKVCQENGFNMLQLAQAKMEFWNSKELDEEILINSYQKVQLHFLRWCRINKNRIKENKNGVMAKAIHPTVKEIVHEEKKERPKYAQSEAEYLWCQSMQAQFKQFKETGILSPHSPTMQYKMFVERGLLKEGDSDSFLDKATEIVLTQKKQLRIMGNHQALTDSIHRIQEGKLSDNDKSEINQQSKLLSLENLFTGIESLKL